MFVLGLDELDTICDLIPLEGILLLRGNLASGKTTLVKKLANKLWIKEDITSPTFSILQSYEDKLFHYDIYQEKTEGFVRQGLYENLEKPGLHVIEWGDNELEIVLKRMGYEYICINICQADSDDKRCYEVYDNA